MSAAGWEIEGIPRIQDGDTIFLHGIKIRLVDAAEDGQLCYFAEDQPWDCSQATTYAFTEHIGGKLIRCERTAKDSRYRTLAACYLHGEDINAWLVREGWAVAYQYDLPNTLKRKNRQ